MIGWICSYGWAWGFSDSSSSWRTKCEGGRWCGRTVLPDFRRYEFPLNPRDHRWDRARFLRLVSRARRFTARGRCLRERSDMTEFADLTLATTAHNNEQMSAAMLRSFEANLGAVAEVVIVDDGSRTVYGAPLLRSPVRVIRNAQAQGFCRASDLALREVRTNYALLVDADIMF